MPVDAGCPQCMCAASVPEILEEGANVPRTVVGGGQYQHPNPHQLRPMARDHFRLCTCSQRTEVQPVGYSLIARLGVHSNPARQEVQARQGRAKSRGVQRQRQVPAMLQKGKRDAQAARGALRHMS